MSWSLSSLMAWVRKLQKTCDVDAISLNGIDTTIAWRVETNRSVMELFLGWLEEEAPKEVSRKREVEEEVTPPPSRTKIK